MWVFAMCHSVGDSMIDDVIPMDQNHRFSFRVDFKLVKKKEMTLEGKHLLLCTGRGSHSLSTFLFMLLLSFFLSRGVL